MGNIEIILGRWPDTLGHGKEKDGRGGVGVVKNNGFM